MSRERELEILVLIAMRISWMESSTTLQKHEEHAVPMQTYSEKMRANLIRIDELLLELREKQK